MCSWRIKDLEFIHALGDGLSQYGSRFLDQFQSRKYKASQKIRKVGDRLR